MAAAELRDALNFAIQLIDAACSISSSEIDEPLVAAAGMPS